MINLKFLLLNHSQGNYVVNKREEIDLLINKDDSTLQLIKMLSQDNRIV